MQPFRKRLGKKDPNAKARKKEMGLRAKTMLQELAARHARELADLESGKSRYERKMRGDHLC